MNTNDPLFLLATSWAGCDQKLAESELRSLAATESGGPAAPDPQRDPSQARRVVEFWRDAGPVQWFAKDAAFDRRFRETFASLHEAAALAELRDWTSSAEGALALILLLDQYPRNAFRGTPRMYDTDPLARSIAALAINAGHDRLVEPSLRLFIYLPYGHSENLAHQERSVELSRSLGQPSLSRAEHHRDIIRRFGRFPHRNAILGRASRPEEERFLAEGGFAG